MSLEAMPAEATPSNLEMMRDRLRSTATASFEAGGKNAPDVLPPIIAAGSVEGFKRTFPGQDVVDTEVLRHLLERASQDAGRAFGTVVTGPERAALSPALADDNDKRFKNAQTDVPLLMNKELARKFAALVYPDANPENVDKFLKRPLTFTTIVDLTARQLGIEAKPVEPGRAMAVLDEVVPKDEKDYTRFTVEELRSFIQKEGALHNEKDVLTVDLLLRLANAVWAGGQVAVAAYKEQPERLQATTFDTPEGRTRVMYEKYKAQYGEEAALYLTALENAKDYLNLIA